MALWSTQKTQAGWRGRECICATLWRGTRPQSFLGKKKNVCLRNVVQLWCHGAPRFVHSFACQGCALFYSLWASGSSFQWCGYGWLQHIRLRSTFDLSHAIAAQAFSTCTSPCIQILINQLTTSRYTALCLFSLTQPILPCLRSLSYRKTHLSECKAAPHSRAITMHSSNTPTANIPMFQCSLLFFGKRFHIYRILPLNFSSDMCLF